MPELLDLPPELLMALPLYLANIEDFVNAGASCRTMRTMFAETHPNTVLRLSNASAPTFFSPHPHVLVLATARKVAHWATGNVERTAQLHVAFHGGMDGLLELAVSAVGLTMAEIRELYNTRLDVMNVLADKIDKMAGKQWSTTPNFWNGGVSEPLTLDTDASAAAYQIAIYGELFGPTLRACLEHARDGGTGPLPGFDRALRMDFIRYCIPEWVIDPQESRNDGDRVALPVGPYTPGHEMLPRGQWELEYVVGCGRWRRMWFEARDSLGLTFEGMWRVSYQSWRSRYWAPRAVQCMGLEALKLVTIKVDPDEGETKKARQWLADFGALIEAIPSEPPVDLPDIKAELRDCYGGR